MAMLFEPCYILFRLTRPCSETAIKTVQRRIEQSLAGSAREGIRYQPEGTQRAEKNTTFDGGNAAVESMQLMIKRRVFVPKFACLIFVLQISRRVVRIVAVQDRVSSR